MEQYATFLWVGLAIAFALAELLTISFFMFPFTIGALAALCAYALGATLFAQFGVFIVVSFICLAILPKFARAITKNAPPSTIAADRLTNTTGYVVKTIPGNGQSGIVRVEGEEWSALSKHDTIIQAGSSVYIAEMTGTYLIVEPQ